MDKKKTKKRGGGNVMMMVEEGLEMSYGTRILHVTQTNSGTDTHKPVMIFFLIFVLEN